MEKSEPSFVPEWLRSNGSNSGGSGHLFPSAPSYSGTSSVTCGRNRLSKGFNSFDAQRSSSFFDRSSSSNSRKIPANGSPKNPYSNFNRHQRDKDYDFIGTLSSNRMENGNLKRSQPIIPRKQANGNKVLHKAVLEKDFPSLDKPIASSISDAVHVASSISDAVHVASSISTMSTFHGEGWTSALVDSPPSTITSSGLNMAEALTQIPAKTRILQPSVPKRDEIAIKQSRQLIPVTPSTAKASKPKSLAKMDSSKSQHGKLFVLKPGWESSAPQSPKEKVLSGDRKASTLNLMTGLSLEKKPSPSQTQSRNDFFNYLKKKTMLPATSAVVAPTDTAQTDAVCGTCADNTLSFSEEETAFLRSLGWDENSGEEGLTEEEISSFYKENTKGKPEKKMGVDLNV